MHIIVCSSYRRCVENAFGITAARWRVLLRTISLHPKNVDYVVKACCILHNFLSVVNAQSQEYTDSEDRFGNIVPGCWRESLSEVEENDVAPHYFPLEATRARNFDPDAGTARKLFMAYFCSKAGEVPWQWTQPGVKKDEALKNLYKEKLLPLH